MGSSDEAAMAAGDDATGLTLRASAVAEGGSLVGTWAITGAGRDHAAGRLVLAEALGLGPPRLDDWAVFAALAAAVRLGGTIVVDGAVSRRALAEAAEVSRAWASFGQGARAVTFSARIISDDVAEGAGDSAILAMPAGGDPAHAVPEGLSVTRVVMPGPLPAGAVARAAEAGRSLLALADAEAGAEGPEPGFFTRITRLAAAMHLLAGEARFGLLLIEPGVTPRIGPTVSPAHVSAFLSGGAMRIIPLLDPPGQVPAAPPPAAPALHQRSRPLRIAFAQTVRGGATRRSLFLEGLADRPAGERLEMWWESPGAPDLPEPVVLDQMVAACVIPAMMRGQDVVVDGPLSRQALVRLPLLAATRHDWGVKGPRREIALHAASVRDPAPEAAPPRAVLTFSGGVDSFYSLLWRTGPAPPPAEPTLAAAVLSLGFDIPLAQVEAFERHRARLAPVLERRGVALHVVHSNARALGLAHWDHVAMPMISAALSQFAHRYAWGIVGGARSYPLTTVPTIQSPLVDCALSGDWFSVAADAVGIGRTEKVALICEHADALAALRVCYEENTADFARNCCRCGKCQRTMLNFLACGLPHPPCFDTVPDPMALAEVPFHKATDLEFADDVIAYARAHGHAGPWADRLEERRQEWVPPAKTLLGRVRAKAVLWGRRMRRDPVGTPALAVRKALARLGRGGRGA